MLYRTHFTSSFCLFANLGEIAMSYIASPPRGSRITYRKQGGFFFFSFRTSPGALFLSACSFSSIIAIVNHQLASCAMYSSDASTRPSGSPSTLPQSESTAISNRDKDGHNNRQDDASQHGDAAMKGLDSDDDLQDDAIMDEPEEDDEYKNDVGAEHLSDSDVYGRGRKRRKPSGMVFILPFSSAYTNCASYSGVFFEEGSSANGKRPCCWYDPLENPLISFNANCRRYSKESC